MAFSDHDHATMARAIALARKGRFAVEPNPPVGCVIEQDQTVVGEGWHKGYAGPHAEIEALTLAGESAHGATAYVSLEPCNHDGKTPPCVDALIAAKVERVVYGTRDPNPEAADGIERLVAAGIQVDGPLLEADARALLARFVASLESARPWIIGKWAMSLDGSIAPRRGGGGAISGRRAQLVTHDLRGRVDAIAVGIGTVLADDPLLTCRLEGGPAGGAQPMRVVFDPLLHTPLSARLVRDARSSSVVIVCGERVDDARRDALEAAGCETWVMAVDDDALDLDAVTRALRTRGVRRMLVEGGARIHGAFLRAGLVDQVTAFVAPRILGGIEAVPAVVDSGFDDLESAPVLEEVMWRKVGDDLMLQGYVP